MDTHWQKVYISTYKIHVLAHGLTDRQNVKHGKVWETYLLKCKHIYIYRQTGTHIGEFGRNGTHDKHRCNLQRSKRGHTSMYAHRDKKEQWTNRRKNLINSNSFQLNWDWTWKNNGFFLDSATAKHVNWFLLFNLYYQNKNWSWNRQLLNGCL